MVDLRPVAYVIGRILIVLAILMLAPAIIDWRAGLENGYDFLACAALTGVVGGGDVYKRQVFAIMARAAPVRRAR